MHKTPIVEGTLELHLLVVWWRVPPVFFLIGVVFISARGVLVGSPLLSVLSLAAATEGVAFFLAVEGSIDCSIGV